MNLTALIALATLGVQDPASLKSADRMVELATADQPLVTIGIVPASVRDVWTAWTTTDGIKKWMVASGEVDFRMGGAYRTSYAPNSDLKGPDSIVNDILAYDPYHMIVIKNSKVPAQFPFKEAMSKAWTCIYFRAVDAKSTEVIVRMNGFDHTDESQKMKSFFKQGNQATLDALIKRFKS